MQLLVNMQQLLDLHPQAGSTLGDGPAADHLGDVFFVHLFLQQLELTLLLRQPLLFLLELAFQPRQSAIAQLRGAVEVVLALGLLDL